MTMTPSERRRALEDLNERAVCRDGMSPERFERLQAAETVDDLVDVFSPIFEPSQEEEVDDE